MATHEPEIDFGGPFGTAFISIGLPILVWSFSFICNDISGCPAPSLLQPSTFSLDRLKAEVGWPADGFAGLFDLKVSAWVVGYYVLGLVLYKILPAQVVQGTELEIGGRLTYKFNALYTSGLILSVVAAGTLMKGAEFPLWTFIDENQIQIVSANIIIAFFVATFVYVRSFGVKPGNKDMRELAAGGSSGNMVYDWFKGRELNPRVVIPWVGEVDIKEFCEVRPGLLGWMIMNFSYIAKQYRNYGYVTDSILFVTAAQAVYVIDCWVYEPAIMTTMDITTDGFGFMLAFGDLAWVPFIYSVQTRYLSVYPSSLGPLGCLAILALVGVAFYIFRSSNSEKNAFRTNPSDPAVAHLKYIQTERGSKLLVSGWWGVARHINYLGDWLQAWPYCLPTGLAGYTIFSAGSGMDGAFRMLDGREVVQGDAKGWAMAMTYFYVVYFGVLLVHRDLRDDIRCSRKYGKDWDRYKKIVRWRIIPGIY